MVQGRGEACLGMEIAEVENDGDALVNQQAIRAGQHRDRMVGVELEEFFAVLFAGLEVHRLDLISQSRLFQHRLRGESGRAWCPIKCVHDLYQGSLILTHLTTGNLSVC